MRKVDNLPPSCAVVMKSGSLNFLEPSGPIQACNGTALPFTTTTTTTTSTPPTTTEINNQLLGALRRQQCLV